MIYLPNMIASPDLPEKPLARHGEWNANCEWWDWMTVTINRGINISQSVHIEGRTYYGRENEHD